MFDIIRNALAATAGASRELPLGCLRCMHNRASVILSAVVFALFFVPLLFCYEAVGAAAVVAAVAYA